MRHFGYSRLPGNQRWCATVNAVLIGGSYAFAVNTADSMRKSMDAQKIAVDAVVALTDCDREQVTAFIRRLYLAGVKDPKRLTFKGLQALTRG
jgi:hypothetical protein